MSQNNNDFNPFDPTGMFKTMRDTGMDAWSKMMLELVHSEAYAEATGKMLDTWLATSGPFRKAIESAMKQSLANLNMPSRTDVISLAERLTNIELRLDDLEAKVDNLQPASRPTRRKSDANNN